MSNLTISSSEYLDFLDKWLDELPEIIASNLVPQEVAFVSVDVIEGFHRVGPLASPRVAEIIPHIVTLVEKLSSLGVSEEHIMFIQDCHPKDAQEFEAYPPHCLEGSEEAEAVKELKRLPRWKSYQQSYKNSVACHTSKAFNKWLDKLEVTTIIAVGDVTDICLYMLAMHLQVRNLEGGLKQRIIVPANCVQTWNAPDHPGDLYHLLFLHHMSRNGIEVVNSIV